MMFNPLAGLPDDRKSMYSQRQHSVYKTGDKTSPISVILVSSGSRGNKLLFRYPFQRVAECPSSLTGRRSINLALSSPNANVSYSIFREACVFKVSLSHNFTFIQWWNVTKYIYSSTVLKHNF